ncbi:MAG: hypothetical protein IT428_21435 [Planctomycetaceae bacterium]|nr:hypothetical protein [Planctomycetaceae bacterium]
MNTGHFVRVLTLAGMTAVVLLAGCVMPMGQVGYDDPPWLSPYARPLNSFPSPRGQSPGSVQVGRPPAGASQGTEPALVAATNRPIFESDPRTAPKSPEPSPRKGTDTLPESDPSDGSSLSVPSDELPSRESEKPSTRTPIRDLTPSDTRMPELRVPSSKVDLKINAPKTAGLNEPITYDVTLVNTSNETLEDVRVDCEFDDELDFLGKPDKRVSRTFESLEPGERHDFRLTLSATRAGRHCSQFSVAIDGLEQARQSVCVEAAARSMSLRIIGPRTRPLGTRAEFTIKAANVSGAALEHVTLVLRPESTLRAFEWSEGGERAGNELRWNLGTIAAGEGVQLQAEFDCHQPSEETALTATVEADGQKSQTATAYVRIRPRHPHLRLDLTDDRDPVTVGEDAVFELTAQNIGLQPLEKLALTFHLPAELEAGKIEARIGGQTLDPEVARRKGIVHVTLSDAIPVDGALTLQLRAKGVGEGDVWLSVSASAAGVDDAVEIDESVSIGPARSARK